MIHTFNSLLKFFSSCFKRFLCNILFYEIPEMSAAINIIFNRNIFRSIKLYIVLYKWQVHSCENR